MIMNSTSWEPELLRWAVEAIEHHHQRQNQHRGTFQDSNSNQSRQDRQNLMKRAYAECQRITAENSRTFYLASGLLGNEKRDAVRALYAFCRVSDDLVDKAEGDRRKLLKDWFEATHQDASEASDLVVLAWADARHRYQIPDCYVEQFMDGVGRDLAQTRYETFDDLAEYCYGVASTVGLMSMHIIGYSGFDAVGYAIKLGIALQLTNILRDVGEDWRAGRVYLPTQELAFFGLTEADIDQAQVTDRWRSFMKFQINRARQLYAESLPGIARLNRDGRFAIAAAGLLYQEILKDIEAHDYDVFNRRAHLSAIRKIFMLPKIWLQSR